MHWTQLNQIVAGDFPKGTRIITKGVFKKTLILVWGGFGTKKYKLRNEIIKTELINKNNYKEGSFGWGVLGGITAGPLGFIIGQNLGGLSWEETICACYLKDGRKFLAVVSRPVYLLLQTEAFEYKKQARQDIPKKSTPDYRKEELSINKNSPYDAQFCVFCGERVPLDGSFCMHCGREIE